MLSTPVGEAFAALDAAVEALGALDFGALAAGQQLQALERLETVRRKAGAVSCDLAAVIDRYEEKVLGGIAHTVIADVLRTTVAEARRRTRDGAQLSPRTTLTGQELAPLLAATAKAWHGGLLDPEHLRTVQKFLRDLPADVHPDRVEKVEAFLAEKATELRPDQLATLAERLAATINPDGRFSDEYRAAQRGFSWCGRQRPDGMSVGKLVASPELRAMPSYNESPTRSTSDHARHSAGPDQST
jgi:hypothetical protein